MLKLYCFPRSGNSREVRIVLAEKSVPFEALNVHADASIKESAEFKKASPKGKVPAIIDGEVYMSEAFLINQYLDKKYQGTSLYPESKRAEIDTFVADYDKSFVLQIGLLLIECILKPKEQQKEEVKEAQRAKIRAGLAKLEAMLEGKQYLFGEFSLADVSVIPHIAALPMLGSGIPAEFTNAAAWFERVKKRPSFAASQG
jgi:glutathione S-transferase